MYHLRSKGDVTDIEGDVVENTEPVSENPTVQTKSETEFSLADIMKAISLSTEQNKINLQIQNEVVTQRTNELKDMINSISYNINERIDNLSQQVLENDQQIKIVSENCSISRDHIRTEMECIRSKHDTDMEKITNKIRLLENKISNNNADNNYSDSNVNCKLLKAILKPNKVPNFNGTSLNPKKELEAIKEFVLSRHSDLMETSFDNKDLISDLAECLSGSASLWFHQVKNSLDSWSDFETRFLNVYFNENVQRKLRMMVQAGRYQPTGTESMTIYFQRKYDLASYIYSDLTESQKVGLIATHFPDDVQTAVLIQSISTYENMLVLLQKFDHKSNAKTIFTSDPKKNQGVNNPTVQINKPRNFKDHFDQNKQTLSQQNRRQNSGQNDMTNNNIHFMSTELHECDDSKKRVGVPDRNWLLESLQEFYYAHGYKRPVNDNNSTNHINNSVETFIDPQDNLVNVNNIIPSNIYKQTAESIKTKHHNPKVDQTLNRNNIFSLNKENVEYNWPMISIKVANKDITALLDTGCNLSVISANYLNCNPDILTEGCLLKIKPLKIRLANNHFISGVNKELYIPIKIGDVKLHTKFLVIPNLSTDFIIGLDFFKTYDCILDFKKCTLSFRKEQHTFTQYFVGHIEKTSKKDTTHTTEAKSSTVPINHTSSHNYKPIIGGDTTQEDTTKGIRPDTKGTKEQNICQLKGPLKSEHSYLYNNPQNINHKALFQNEQTISHKPILDNIPNIEYELVNDLENMNFGLITTSSIFQCGIM